MRAAPEIIPAWDGISAAFPYSPVCGDQDDTPAQVQSIMTGWHDQCDIIGGFMWLYDDFVGTGLAAQYANAINTAVGGTGFTISGPSSVFLNQSSTASAAIDIKPLNGFSGTVNLSLSTLPKGVQALILGQGNQRKLEFKATPSATTGFTTMTITGTSGSIVQTLTLTLAVSAATGSNGSGTHVDLSSEFNVNGIYTDGSVYTTGGLDGDGYSYSANLLTPSRVFDGILFDFGPPNSPDAIGCAGQSVSLPAGEFSYLRLLATGVEGDQASQAFTVTYTDGTTSQFVQSLSDWYTPANYSGESEGVAMAYRNFDNGTKDQRTFNLYEYQFHLNKAKVVQSVTLPNNSHVLVLAATLK